MITVTFQGFVSMEHAQAFASWYCGAGEQESEEWLEASGVPSAYLKSGTKVVTDNSITLTIESE
jgi:hypothetical protein